ncbi:MAG TPA: CCA tRNA nucleotidyltransferase [Bacillota bacterium]|nr:CCA tRNA nucleotidyltransferase [Bacillota bacterium]HPF42583.1 CCA tRNA nucleotidyltransferase [Bacillota bacterium]HPJ86050.1 CCA tRNA nucleotidyltransferase [Bacillota bacterium]HPQ62103.1 CCA tRNA nucleotidyltransferase [Bacillota bacterium]HRX91519.1 CCA tRNA nucleotidyltransferase [Candidatus Izemoplasmatales bacterium]
MEKRFEAARKILAKLIENNHAAYMVGGFVRDRMLGLETDDIDITTDARPETVELLFESVKETGIRFGTVTVLIDGYSFEVTTFRSEGKYSNFRHPDTIAYSDTLEEDLKRRDFTINAFAMAYDGSVIDIFSGRDDLKRRLIRAIGYPEARFYEDALRILRAFRFVSKLDFQIETGTFKAIRQNRMLLNKIASERILQEMKKIILYPHHAKAFRLMKEASIGEALPFMNKAIEYLSGREDWRMSDIETYALATFLNQEKVPDEWRFSNKEKEHIHKLAQIVKKTFVAGFDPYTVYEYGFHASIEANNIIKTMDPDKNGEKDIIAFWQKLPIRNETDLAFRGKDILAIPELKDPKQIGKILETIIREIISGRLKNEREAIRGFVRKYMEKELTEKTS